MTQSDNTTGTSLVRSIATENLADVLGKVAETSLDAVLDDGIIRDVPIIGMITGILKVGRDIRNELFIKKILIFLSKISNASAEERGRFSSQFEDDKDRHRFGEAILLLLERAEDMDKPKIIGRIMCAAIRGSIDVSKAMRLCSIVNRCYLVSFRQHCMKI